MGKEVGEDLLLLCDIYVSIQKKQRWGICRVVKPWMPHLPLYSRVSSYTINGCSTTASTLFLHRSFWFSRCVAALMQLVKVYVIYEYYRKVKLKRADSLTERKSKSHQTINPVSRSTKSLAPWLYRNMTPHKLYPVQSGSASVPATSLRISIGLYVRSTCSMLSTITPVGLGVLSSSYWVRCAIFNKSCREPYWVDTAAILPCRLDGSHRSV